MRSGLDPLGLLRVPHTCLSPVLHLPSSPHSCMRIAVLGPCTLHEGYCDVSWLLAMQVFLLRWGVWFGPFLRHLSLGAQSSSLVHFPLAGAFVPHKDRWQGTARLRPQARPLAGCPAALSTCLALCPLLPFVPPPPSAW